MATDYKRTVAGSVGAGVGALFNGSGRTYYILEHKTATEFHKIGESQKIIVDQAEMGRDKSCQICFDENCVTVSRKHAAIVKEGEGWKIITLSKTNQTLVNGKRVESECILNSGDEIQLSTQGPVMGFIVPQGAKSLVKSIGMTERMNLFRQQALRPYKTGITIIAVVLILSIGGLIAYNIIQDKQHGKQMAAAKEQILAANAEIDMLMARARTASEEIEMLNRRAQDATLLIDSLLKENSAANEALSALTAQADSAEIERLTAMRQLDSLKNITSATHEELQKATARAKKAEREATAARKAAEEARVELQAKTDMAQTQLDSLKSVTDHAIEEMITISNRSQEAEEKAQLQLDSLKIANRISNNMYQRMQKDLEEASRNAAIARQTANNVSDNIENTVKKFTNNKIVEKIIGKAGLSIDSIQ